MVKRGRIDHAVDYRPIFQRMYQEALKVGGFRPRQIEDWGPKDDNCVNIIILKHRDGRTFEYYDDSGLLRQIEYWREPTVPKVHRNPVFIFREDSYRRIRETMEILGISQHELSRRTGITQSSISKYILGKRAPRISAGTKICEALNIPIHALYDEIDVYGNYVYEEPDHTFDDYADYGDDENEEDSDDWEDEEYERYV